MRRLIVSVIILSALCGCIFAIQSVDDYDLEQRGIRKGMKKAEVIRALGQPDSFDKISFENQKYEAWRYSIERLWAGKYRPLGSYYYQLLFMNDKLERWNKIKIYSQPSYKFEEPSSKDTKVRTIEILKNR